MSTSTCKHVNTQKLISEYQAGKTYRELATMFGICIDTVGRRLRALDKDSIRPRGVRPNVQSKS